MSEVTTPEETVLATEPQAEPTPSVSNTPIEEPVVAPVVELVAPVEKHRYEYQPTDDSGRPIGGRQVIEYHSQDELVQKLEHNTVLLLRKLRTETRKNRLGILENEEIPQDAPRYQNPVEFTQPTRTPEENYKLAVDLGIDPERLDEVTDALFESKLGVSPDTLRTTLKTIQEDLQFTKTKLESEAFVAANKDYYPCKDNFEAIANWITRYKLAPVRENFQKAYDTLKTAGVIVEAATAVQAEPPPPPVVEQVIPAVPVQVPVVEPPPPAPPVSRIPTGLTRNQSSDTGTVRSLSDDIIYEHQPTDGKGKPYGEKRIFKGLAAIEAMPSDVYKHRVLHEAGFIAKEEKLRKEATDRRNKVRQ